MIFINVRQECTLRDIFPLVLFKGAKIVMTTALENSRNILASFKGLCDVYLTKPVDKAKLLGELRKLKLIA